MPSIIGIPILLGNRQTDVVVRENVKMTTFGMRLKACRKESGYTQKEVCSKSGLSQGTLSELENDMYPTSSFVPHLAQIYGVEPMWLATGNGQKTKKEAQAFNLSETAIQIAAAVNQMSPLYQEALLALIKQDMQKKEEIPPVVEDRSATTSTRKIVSSSAIKTLIYGTEEKRRKNDS